MAKVRFLLFVLLFSCLIPLPAFGLEISAVVPGTAAPGAIVTVSGGPFQKNARVMLGDRAITPKVVGERQLVFTVPSLKEGEYALYVRQGEASSAKTFTLRVVFPAPRILSIQPTNLDVCSDAAQRWVTVEGRNFQSGADLLLNNAVVAHSKGAGETITFTAPPLSAGIYGVRVVNPDGRRSLPHSLWYNNLPEITSVSRGQDFTTYYQVILKGKNFFFNSTLVVNEYPIDAPDTPPQQRAIPVRQKGATLGLGDNVFFADCHTLIYNRYPVSTQPRQISLQVINPDGKASSSYTLSIP